MQSVAMFLPLVVVTALYASFLKLAVRILRFRGITWAHAFLFAVLIVLLSMLIRGGSIYFGAQLPTLLGLFLGVGLHLLLGAWFFRARALGQDGTVVGWSGGAKLSALTIAFLLLVGVGLVGVMRALLPSA